MSWQTVKLKEVADIVRDGITSEAIQTGTSYLGLEHIEAGGRILGAATVKAGDLASTKFKFTRNHVLYGKLRPYLAKIAMPDFDGICSTDIVPIMPGPDLDRSFLTHYLRQPSMVEFANSLATGANLPRLSPKSLADFDIPFPSLQVQKRIAAILDQADQLRRKRRGAIDRLNQLGQAIFQEMFRDFDGGDLPVAQLGALTSKIGSGATPRGGDSAYKAEGTPLIRSMNVRDGEFSEAGLAFLDSQQAAKLNNVTVQANDVLLNITGASVARVCLAPPHMEGARVNQHVSIIRLSKSMTSEFLEAFLLMPRTKGKLLMIAESGATRQAITKAQIEELEVPVPALDRQHEFVERLKLARKSAAAMKSQSMCFEAMFASLQHRAFRGEL